MSLLDTYALCNSDNLKHRTTVCVAAAAFAILTESPETTNHLNRLSWARKTLPHVEIEAARFMWGVIGSPTVLQLGEAIDDGSLSYIVNQLVDTFAGI